MSPGDPQPTQGWDSTKFQVPGKGWKGLIVPSSPQAPLELLQAFSRAGWDCRTAPPQAITPTLGGLCALIKTVLLSGKASSLPSPLAASVLLKVKPSHSTPEKGLNWMLDSFDLMSQSTPLPNCSSESSSSVVSLSSSLGPPGWDLHMAAAGVLCMPLMIAPVSSLKADIACHWGNPTTQAA